MHNPAAQLVGLLATILGVSSLHFKTPRGLLLCQTAGNIAFVIHYLMLGAYSASIGQLLTILNSLAVIWVDAAGTRRRGWQWIFSALSLAAGAAVWKDGFSVLPCLGTVVMILASWTFNNQIIRLSRLCIASPGWILYDIHVKSWAGILCETIVMISSLLAFVRFQRQASLRQKALHAPRKS